GPTMNLPKRSSNLLQILTTLGFVLAVSGLVVGTVYPEPKWLGNAISGLGVVLLVIAAAKHFLKPENRRTAAFGANSFITVALVLGILGVANFLALKFPKKLDVTKNHINTLSDQTEKVFKNLSQPVKLVFWAKLEEREKIRPLLGNLKGLSSKVE